MDHEEIFQTYKEFQKSLGNKSPGLKKILEVIFQKSLEDFWKICRHIEFTQELKILSDKRKAGFAKYSLFNDKFYVNSRRQRFGKHYNDRKVQYFKNDCYHGQNTRGRFIIDNKPLPKFLKLRDL
jgi:hypothetical protein